MVWQVIATNVSRIKEVADLSASTCAVGTGRSQFREIFDFSLFPLLLVVPFIFAQLA